MGGTLREVVERLINFLAVKRAVVFGDRPICLGAVPNEIIGETVPLYPSLLPPISRPGLALGNRQSKLSTMATFFFNQVNLFHCSPSVFGCNLVHRHRKKRDNGF